MLCYFTLEQETIRAINKLRRPDLPKIQKLQLMRQYFKDVKAKMQKEETESQKIAAAESFSVVNRTSKGVFVKKKLQSEKDETAKPFLFNFNDSSGNELTNLNTKIDALSL
jgi:Domain of unknown function (DUF4615)